MKSAGQSCSQASTLPGKPSVAQEATAESNQTSKMSSTRRMAPPQAQGMATSSTNGRWGSGTAQPESASSSAIVPTTRRSLQAGQTQTGIGIPQ